MAQVELIMPKMGESIIEATILNWVKGVGDTVEADETILEIATDKVDSEVPSPVDGTIAKILFEPDTTVAVGEVIALIETEAGAEIAASPATGEAVSDVGAAQPVIEPSPAPANPHPAPAAAPPATPAPATMQAAAPVKSSEGRFYSPLVRTMAAKENIGQTELDQIPGTGKGGRVNKADMIAYLERRDNSFITGQQAQSNGHHQPASAPTPAPAAPPAAGDEIIEMDRMR
ncbi:MAG: biotin/lipoyl-containing protein, partial [Bacteroidota bacterium]